jgi:ABC-type uncharacterized transport system auxiliary subunit
VSSIKKNGVIEMMRRLLILFLIVVPLTACSMPETKIYSLNLPDTSPPKTQKQDRQASLTIIMDAPRHLAQPYIANRNSPYQLRISHYAKWESPPGDMVQRALKDSLYAAGMFDDVRASNILYEGSFVLEINLKRFERTEDGKDIFGELAFEMKLVSPENKQLIHDTVVKKVRIEDHDFLSLAKGMSTALSEAAGEVTEKVSHILSH